MKQLIILTVFILFQVSVFGQINNRPCGTQLTQDDYNSIKATLLERGSLGKTNFSKNLITITVKLKPHIVRRSNGTGGLSIAELYTSINQLNQRFAQASIHFEICSINYINNDAYFNGIITGVKNSEYQMGRSNISKDMVNVFFVPRGVEYSSSPFAYNWSYYPISLINSLNWTIITNSYATDGGTLAHEIGHYFNLIHTHGSEVTSFNEHVTRYGLKGCIKNCDTTGDLLCDTPADPDLGGDNGGVWPPIAQRVDADCNYIDKETLVDACGISYQPDTHNIMSYAYHCRNHFSQGQIARMREAIKLDRPEVISRNLQYSSIVTDNILNGKKAFGAQVFLRASNEIYANARGVYYAGNDVTFLPGFTAKTGSQLDAFIGNSCIVYTIDPPIKDDLLKKSNKKESYPLQELEVSIYPIPVKDKATIKFNLQNDIDKMDISLYNLTGFMVKKLAKETSYKKGDHTLTLDASGLTPKVYVIIFNTSEGERITKKIIVR